MKYKTGDIFISERGMSFEIGGAKSLTYTMFEYDESLANGKGRWYTSGGNHSTFSWVYPEQSMRLDFIPAEYLRSFKHGVNNFSIEESIKEQCLSPLEILLKSNFKIISEQEIMERELAEKCTTLDLIKDNIDVVMKHHSPTHSEILFLNTGHSLPAIQNGELGLWCMWIYNLTEGYKKGLIRCLFDEEFKQAVRTCAGTGEASSMLEKGDYL